uniref:MOB kinase activator-like 3 n=1 Tax=Strongyloides papillosus TaxID=174720 RepID=A0A0N5BZG6_STREA
MHRKLLEKYINMSKSSALNFFEFLHLNKDKTFRPKKKFRPGTLRYNLHKRATATLKSGIDLKEAVKVPSDDTFEDWLAVHTVEFFNRINLLYGVIQTSCTSETCPIMSGGERYEYLWQDGDKYPKPTQLPAPEYVNNLMEWVEGKINDERIFPPCVSVPFPPDFKKTCKKILTRLHRVLVHVFIHHFDCVRLLGVEPHANTLYKHFYFFVTEHSLVSSKELDALKGMTNALITKQ